MDDSSSFFYQKQDMLAQGRNMFKSRHLSIEVFSTNNNRWLKNTFRVGESLESKDYFLTAIGLFTSAFIIILIAGVFSMVGASRESIDWIYLTIPPAIFAFSTGVGFVIAGILRALISK